MDNRAGVRFRSKHFVAVFLAGILVVSAGCSGTSSTLPGSPNPPGGAGSGSGSPPSGTQAAAPTEASFRDFSYGTTGNSTPTGEKPESKLWWNDGYWWGSLYNDAQQEHHIYRLDWAAQSWVDTGTALDDRNNSKGDALWDAASQKLYLASHVFTTNAQPTSVTSQWGRLYRYSYHSGSKTYSLDSGFPVTVTQGVPETLTLAKDSRGRLWVTRVEASQVMVNHSLASDSEWGTPFVLPASSAAVSVTSDDISAIIAFGGNRVGVMWSNQSTQKTYFAVHWDADAATTWQAEEIVVPDANCGGACSDDLFNLKTDSSGRVLAVLKTSLINLDEPLNLVTVRGANGGWTSSVFGLVRDHHTRAILLLDEENGQVYVFATNPEKGGAIYYKSAPLNALRFPTGLGTPFIQSSTDSTINNATSTKQNLNSQTDLVVLASDQNTRFYLRSYLDLGAAASPAITSLSPASGPVGTAVTLTGSRFTGATSVAFNGTAATFTVASDTQINTTVPSGATTGKISVTTPAGTGFSAADFGVTSPPSPPQITSFTPASGPVGTAVAIDGAAFTGATSVSFNGVAASFTVASDRRINTTVPSGATTGKIAVTTPLGTATSAADFRVTRPPTVTSFLPTAGILGTPVRIVGSRFTGATEVAFNGFPAPVFAVLGDTEIVAVVPVGASTGKISVTTSEGTGFSTTDFTVIF